MRRQPSMIGTLVAVAVTATATSIGVIAWAVQDDDRQGWMGGAGMTAEGSGSTPGWQDGSWGPITGMMGWAGSAGEPEYLAEMIAHHEEAVAAARELARSDRVEMQSFGETIADTQSAQIEQMRTWLRQWYPEQSATVHYRPMMQDLSGLAGDRLDRAFLQDMTDHHMLAVMMSQHLLRRGFEHGEVAELARSIRDEQRTEIVQMQRWLEQWFGAPWRGVGICLGRGSGPGGMISGSWR